MSDAAIDPGASTKPPSTVKETVISLIIAFVVAFVFRGFVLEPFMIPTGSMAPTLMGAHMRFDDPQTGFDWSVNYWDRSSEPSPRQGTKIEPIVVHDPMGGGELREHDVPLRSGDRIFVLKSVYSFFDPSRFDVVVFKFPGSTKDEPPGSQNNYIKRLIGLPGEQLALIDGDVFTRPASMAKKDEDNPWSGEGWTIARKPERVQRAVWQPLFDSQYTPLNAQLGKAQFYPPWKGTTQGWDIASKAHYRYQGAEPTALEWNWDAHPITDWTPYNEVFMLKHYPPPPGEVTGLASTYPLQICFPVSDLRARCTLTPDAAGLTMSAVLRTRRHEFRADISDETVRLRMKPDGDDAQWKELVSVPLPAGALKPGRATAVEFWHADQTLSLWIDGKRVAEAGYDWTPAQRVLASTGVTIDDALKNEAARKGFALYDPGVYQTAAFRFEFAGSAFTIHRAAMDRDLYYQPKLNSQNGAYAFATHPHATPTLTPDQFFFCGDNSPASSDSRLWTDVDPFTATQIDNTVGVVNRDLLVGRAFCVYFPAPKPGTVPVPDAGRLRFIW